MKFSKLGSLAVLSIAVLASCGGVKCDHENYLKIEGDIVNDYQAGDHFSTDGLTVSLCCDKCGQAKTITDYTVDEHGDYLKSSTKSVRIEYGDVYYDVPVKVTFDYQFTGTITCVGDSLTAGHNWPNQAYPVYIKDYLPEGSNPTVINCGKNGASFKTFGQYNPAYNTTTEYKNSIKQNPNPDIVTILLGTNDATNWANEKDDFYQDYVDLIHLYQNNWENEPQIILLTSPTTKDPNSFGIPNETIRDEVNPIQRQVAEELDLPLIDLREIFDNYEAGLDALVRPNDGVHFSVEAAKLVAGLIADKIVSVAENNL